MVGGQANQPNHNNLRCGVIDPVIVSAAAAARTSKRARVLNYFFDSTIFVSTLPL